MDYYSKLPLELQNYIQNIIKEETIKDIKKYKIKNKIKNIIEKKNFLIQLIWDLRARNSWTKYITDSIINPNNYSIKIICISDPYTERLLNIMDNLIITGNELFEDNSVYLIKFNELSEDNSVCLIKLWISLLWSIACSIWEENKNTYRNYYTNTEILYYSLRNKTVRGALMNGAINEFSTAPPLIERIPLSELD